ncbi:MAG TPA: HAD family hydrolase [Thermoplasmata archaeon]|nr:HAD family hydrolase [Thermoplasmata archaeon]
MSAERRGAPLALTTDAWYTLYSISTAERRALAERRRRIWAEPLLRHGCSRSEALALLARRDRWTRACEARGKTPDLLEQARQLGRWVGAPVDAVRLAGRLDRTLLRARFSAAPGAVRALRALERDGVPVALVSNVLNETGHAGRTILERLGLLPLLRAVVLSCEHPWAKPSPEPFRLAASFLGTPVSRTAHLGDLAYDIEGARRAGLRAWWFVGLRRRNRYLPGQVGPGTVSRGDTIAAWSEVPPRFSRQAAGRSPR